MGPLTPPITDVVDLPDGGRMLFGEWPGAGDPLVAVPGLTSHHRFASGIAAELDGELRVVAADLRGRGCSSLPSRPGLIAHAEDVLALMDAIGVDDALIAGHSMGAYVAAEVARLAPGRIRGVLLIDGGVHGPGEAVGKAVEEERELIRERLGMSFPSAGEYVDAWRGLATFDRDWNPVLEQYVRYDIGRTADGYAPKADARSCLADFSELLSYDAMRERLREIRCPVAAVGAERGILGVGDPVLGPRHLPVLSGLGIHAELVTAARTCHHTVTLSPWGAATCAAAVRALAARAAGGAEARMH